MILKPLMCYYSQYDRAMMQTFLSDKEVADCYLEKPLPITELISLLRLINIL